MNKRIIKRFILSCLLVFCVSLLLAACGSPKLSQGNPSQNDKSGTTGTSTTGNVSTNNSTNETTGGNNPGADNGDETSAPELTPPPVKDPVKVKALYLTGWTVGKQSRLQHFVDLANSTEINSYVVDIKDDDGYVGYESEVPAVKELSAWKKKYDVKNVLKAFHDNNVHVIGRIVCFKDPVLSSKKPELAIKDINGGLYKTKSTDGKMITWLNPYEKGSWSYLTDIAKEAVELGFDEIQFDYVRFCNDGKRKNMDFSAYSQPKYEAIDEFLDYARKELPGIIISADVFGIICESPADREGIGQNLEEIGKNIDYISPMAYPSHYALGQEVNGVKFSKPDFEPYKVVYNTLLKAKNRISQVEGYKASIRPFLQDFTATWIGKGNYQSYGPEQVRQQIEATYDAGFDEWILWDAGNSYDESALLKETEN
jgi:hypothetical protein